MLLIPAIDLKDGRCVRLRQGDLDDATIFSEDPTAMSNLWLDRGARRLHLVDLNGAVAGKPKTKPSFAQLSIQSARIFRFKLVVAFAILTRSSAISILVSRM